jgi:L-2-hydroxyglutarate oxidase LhgO
MAERVDSVVVGAGVVGLAVARALALAGREVILLEAAEAIGTETSSRNSEVIHAGIYYPAGSLKARLCVAGRSQLYAYCRDRSIAAPPVGKLIVATDEGQRPALEALKRAGEANGVADLCLIEAAEARAIEPEVACVAALRSPSSGIVDSHALMLSLQGDLEAAGGLLVLRTPVLAASVEPNGIRIETGGPEPMTLLAGALVNAAGLHAPSLAGRIDGMPPAFVPRCFLARGVYFSLVGVRPPFRGLVYPLPEPGGLGIHATVDLAGAVRFGPDVEWIERIDYSVDPARGERFAASIRRYWPALPDGALAPAYAGIRPKLSGPGEPAADFVIQGPGEHGVPGLVHLFGIESPGLTSCLAIADEVAGRLEGRRAAA